MTKITNIEAVSTTNCDSWEDFCKEIRLTDGAPIDPIYRGHRDSKWPLVPPSARNKLQQYLRFQNAGIDVSLGGPAFPGQLKYFKHLATGLPGVDISELKEIDIETLSRHHGLCSNLLDWTQSPYIAAFFAFTSAIDQANEGRLFSGTLAESQINIPTEPVCIWRLSITKELWVCREFEILSSLAAVNYWQKAQMGVFTRLTHEEYLDVVSYLAERKLLERLHRSIIPGLETMKALRDLELMNITFATLFPDLRGAALQANIGMTWRIFGG